MSDPQERNRRVMKNLILTSILAVVASDGVWLTWLMFRSECPFADSLAVLAYSAPVERAAMRIAAKMSFLKTEDGLDLLSAPQGNMWVVHGDTVLAFLLAEQERDIYEPPGHEVHSGDIVLDCGANVGVFTRKALSRGAGLVVAIEPAPRTLAALRRNFDAEIRAGRVVVYPKGVWDHDAELELALDEENEGKNSLVIGQEGATKVRVPLTTIDQIVAELNLPRVDFIKMDIEGSEKPALRGAANTIRRFRPRMSLSTEHLPDDSAAIPALVKSIDPRYTYRGCDCDATRRKVIARVLAFDPAP